MALRLSPLLQEVPNRRIIILDLPHHGKNVSLDLRFTDPPLKIPAMADYVEETRQILGIEAPFDLFGYSLGGGVANCYIAKYGQHVNRLMLLAPFFFEIATDTFDQAMQRRNWRDVHAWETFEEMKRFFTQYLGLNESNAPPLFVLRAIHALRKENYPEGYWSAFFDASDAAQGTNHTLLQECSDALGQFKRPTLLLYAADDAVCDAEKLKGLGALFEPSTVHMQSLTGGHTFCTGRGRTIFDDAFNPLLAFLTKEVTPGDATIGHQD